MAPFLVFFSWSTGVIMYTLLAGSPPFWHRKQMLMLRMILSGSYQFTSPEWDDRSDTVKDLVRLKQIWEYQNTCLALPANEYKPIIDPLTCTLWGV